MANSVIKVEGKTVDLAKIDSLALRRAIMAISNYECGPSNWRDTTWKQRRRPCPLLCPG
jgi:hypothetical protein